MPDEIAVMRRKWFRSTLVTISHLALLVDEQLDKELLTLDDPSNKYTVTILYT